MAANTTTPYGSSNYITNGLGIPAHDYIENSYTGNNLTQVIYRLGGSSGTIVGTVVMTYDGSDNLLTVDRTV